ncbi:hypothetical protein EIP86_008089 [Pleurotus ostreatoroseus]|nr:hypothetical protein EIP86_008089 [Pleurotus ostreatoroseus]
MTQSEINALDAMDLKEDLPEPRKIQDPELHIPYHLRPPDPTDTTALPETIHPSFPYGSPFDPRHPAARPRRPFSEAFRSVRRAYPFYNGVYTSLQWDELDLEQFATLDPEQEEAARQAAVRNRVLEGLRTSPAPAAPQDYRTFMAQFESQHQAARQPLPAGPAQLLPQPQLGQPQTAGGQPQLADPQQGPMQARFVGQTQSDDIEMAGTAAEESITEDESMASASSETESESHNSEF